MPYPAREKHHNWKGGGQQNRDGYIRRVIYPENPFWEMGSYHSKTSRTILEHRLVMAESLGRLLTKNETVHHKNGVKDDNRLENLELRQGNHGRGATLCCADCGSKNLVPATIG